MTYATALVLEAIDQGHVYGFDIIDATRLRSGTVYPLLRRLEEFGLVRSKYILLEPTGNGGRSIVDYGTNGDCAAGTGSFIDQQASRLDFKVEEVGAIALSSGKSPQIAGRCSVFAKTEMKPGAVMALIPSSAVNLIKESQITGCNQNVCSNAITIALCPPQTDA